MNPSITFIGPISSFTGYGMLAIEAVRAMESSGGNVLVRPIFHDERFGSETPPDIATKFVSGDQAPEWEVVLNPPTWAPSPGKKTAYFTMWESTKLPPGSVDMLNTCKVVITPSRWNESVFSACGVETPIRVVPLGINGKMFSYRPVVRKGPVVFGTAGRMASGGVRKGINEMIDLFLETFPKEKNVTLKVKGFPDCPIQKVDDPRIEITQRFMSEEELADWYASLTCFVSLARGEGWGLMQHQSMAVGRPVISVFYGGVADFLNPQNAFVVEHRLAKGEHGYAGCGHWAVPDFGQVSYWMRYIYEHPEAAENLGVLASKSVAHLTWENHSKRLVSVLREFGAL